MCGVSVNGAWPIHDAPSPPIWVKVSVVRSGIQAAMKWQPMPATAREPSGTRVEVLCGQPEQKYGVRWNSLGFALPPSTRWAIRARRALTRSTSANASTRSAMASATSVAFSSPLARNSWRPASSCLPSTRGRRPCGRS